jgi:hypothetical protein
VNNYRGQLACENCKHAWRYIEHDGAGDWFCDANNDRPLCGSVALDEVWGFKLGVWMAWASNHFVQPSGICDSWAVIVPEVQP